MNVVEGDLTYLVNMAVHPERFVQHNAKVPHTGRTINLLVANFCAMRTKFAQLLTSSDSKKLSLRVIQ